MKSQVRDFGQRLKGDQPDSPESLQATIDEMMNTLRSITVPPEYVLVAFIVYVCIHNSESK